ncbi:MAG: DUF4238 domain-containing protein [Paracoccaceae bacterium]
MNTRTKKQHFVPRFYLENFTDDHGQLWTHDSQQVTGRQTTPENTAYETNIYTPLDEDGNRIELVEDTLAEIESLAAGILPDLLACRPIATEPKINFSIFLATMFARSPAQLRQFAQFQGEMADSVGFHAFNAENKRKEDRGELSDNEKRIYETFLNKKNYTMTVDRRIGLLGFTQSERMAEYISKMTWTYKISEKQQLLTSDNCFNWINGGPTLTNQAYGFGLTHPQAVVPFPLSPNIILRLDWLPRAGWGKYQLNKQNARLANKYQAKHKERFLYYRDSDNGFQRLGMKYKCPPQQLNSGINAPSVSVVRKLKDEN